MDFEWDKNKAERNFNKHGILFEEATTVFADLFSITIPDPLHSKDEDRFIITGVSHKQRQLIVVYVERENSIRIISARIATSSERKKYEQGRE
ncbi:MAG TPA: BrnT family toxin [Pyrinomonadaceae bacterium]|nr:BrnT family toxin [Pyrinomonadaceae bacterium]